MSLLVTVTSNARPTCEWCGEQFERSHDRGPAPRFCSNAHRQRAYEARQTSRLKIDGLVGRSVINQVQETQHRITKLMGASAFDRSKILGELGATSAFTKQLTAIQDQARHALSFDAAAILRDASVASTLTAQIADIQKHAAKAFTFNTSKILGELDLDRLEAALEDQNLDELEASLPDVLKLDDPGLVAVVAGAVLVAAFLRCVGATLAQVAAAAAENGVETTRLLLQAVDVAYNASSELRGFVILLSVIASIQALRSRS